MHFTVRRPDRRYSVLAVLLALTFAVPPGLLAQEPATSAGLRGKILGPNGSPLGGVRVVLYHLATEQVYSSGLTRLDGQFEAVNLPGGYFDLAVESTDGLFVVDKVVRLTPGETAVISLDVPEAGPPGSAAREFPGIDAEPVGTATVRVSGGGRGFWKSAGGISVIAGAGLVGLLALSSGGSNGGDSGDPSPTLP